MERPLINNRGNRQKYAIQPMSYHPKQKYRRADHANEEIVIVV
jgi:hypothetical protein